MKLISKTQFEDLIDIDSVSDSEFRLRNRKFRNFLKQLVTLGMFVPCDDDDNFLEEPMNYADWLKKTAGVPYILDLSKYEQYQKAQSKVIFKNFSFNSENHTHYFLLKEKIYFHSVRKEYPKTIEDLIIKDLDLVVSF